MMCSTTLIVVHLNLSKVIYEKKNIYKEFPVCSDPNFKHKLGWFTHPHTGMFCSIGL